MNSRAMSRAVMLSSRCRTNKARSVFVADRIRPCLDAAITGIRYPMILDPAPPPARHRWPGEIITIGGEPQARGSGSSREGVDQGQGYHAASQLGENDRPRDRLPDPPGGPPPRPRAN